MRRAFAAGLLLAACATAPPPAAPPPSDVRGYRAKTPQGVDLVFDPALMLFAVPSAPGTYWLDGRYYRRSGTRVDCAPALDGPWQPCPAAELPERLR